MSEKVRIIVAGSRSINNYTLISEKLKEIIANLEKESIIEVISGTCKGVDKLGERYAKENNIALKKFPADWQSLEADICVVKENQYGKYNALAGPDRNQKMVDYAKEENGVLVAFTRNNSRGTKDVVKRAKEANLDTFIFRV